MPNAGYTYLAIKGDFDVKEFTQFVGFSPTTCCAKGKRNPERGLPKCSLWDLSSPKVSGALDIYKLSDELIAGISKYQSLLVKALKHFKAEASLSVVIYFDPKEDYQGTPAMGFSPQVINFLSALNAFVDIDSYMAEPLSLEDYTHETWQPKNG